MKNGESAESKKVTIRSANNFGFNLAHDFIEQLTIKKVLPSKWPKTFPLTLKQILRLSEIDRNNKIAKKVVKAARIIWKDMLREALAVEADMALHPDYYDSDVEQNSEELAWRSLSINIEQISGNMFITEFDNEEKAKTNVYDLLQIQKLEQSMVEFEDDYKNFIGEVREAIRNAKAPIKASEKFELICMLNTNTMAVKKQS